MKGGLKKKMGTIKQEAEAYESKSIKTVADLDVFSIDSQVLKGKGKNKDNEEYDYNYIIVNDVQYRLPDSVLNSVKEIIKESPALTKVKVKKTGIGFQTEYTVIPLV